MHSPYHQRRFRGGAKACAEAIGIKVRSSASSPQWLVSEMLLPLSATVKKESRKRNIQAARALP